MSVRGRLSALGVCHILALAGGALAACSPTAVTDTKLTQAVDGHLTRAKAALDAEDFEKAFAALEAAGALDPHSVDVQRVAEEALVRRAAARPATLTDDSSARIAYAVDALSDVPTLAAARLTAEAQLALARGEAETAGKKLDEAIAAAPDYPHAFLAKAQLLRARGDKLGALAAFESAVNAAPKNVTALNNTGVAYLEYDRAADALKLFEVALGVLDNASTRINAADANLALDRKTEAEEHLKRAALLAPKSALPLRRLGGLLRDEKRFDDAEAVLARALGLEVDAWTCFTLGVIKQELKKHSDAVPLLAKAVELDPQGFAAPYHLAVSLQTLGDTAGADKALERYLALSVNAPEEGERRKQVIARFQSRVSPKPEAPAPDAPKPDAPKPASPF